MPKLEKLEITLDNPSRVYFPGNMVAGSTLIVLNEDMKLRAVRLQVSGEANVNFTVSHGSGKSRHTDHYSAKAVYVTAEVPLWGNLPGSNEDAKMLPSGTQRFHFQFQLPPTCATSYEGVHGSIRYFVKVIMDRPWKFDHTAKLPFSVVELHDLNLEPSAGLPVQNSGRKTLILSSGDLRATVSIPRMGYVAGETIPISAQIDNTTSRSLKRIEVKLIQTAEFTGQHLSKTQVRVCHNTVAKIAKVEDIPEGRTTVWTNEPFPIPALPPMLRSCHIINLSYTLEFSVVPHGPSFDLDVKLPIIIGTIPLRQTFQQFQPSMNHWGPLPVAPGFYPSPPANFSYGTVENQIIQPSAPEPAPPTYGDMYPDLPPPSYEESLNVKGNIRDDGDNEHTKGDMDFSPKYPFYKSN